MTTDAKMPQGDKSVLHTQRAVRTLLERLLPVLTLVLATVAPFPAIADEMSDRKAQRSTMASMRAIGVAWDAYADANNNSYVPAGAMRNVVAKGGSVNPIRWSDFVQITPDFVKSLLEPTYITAVPLLDGWGNPLQFAVGVERGVSTSYLIRSLGSDGVVSSTGTYTMGPITTTAADLVYGNATWVTYPAQMASLDELNKLAPLHHVRALVEGEGLNYSKVDEQTWKIRLHATTVPSLDVITVLAGDLLVAFVVIGDAQKSLKLDVETALLLLRYNNDVDSAKVVLRQDGKIVYRIEARLRTVDRDEFAYMLTQVTKGADGLVAQLLKRPTPSP